MNDVHKIVNSNIPYFSVKKDLKPFGVSIGNYRNADDAKGYTYTTRDGEFPPTPIFFDSNPFNEDIKNAKAVLEIGGGVGRNLPIIMEQTSAHYYMVDPNEKMHEHFWSIQPNNYRDRVTLCKTFEELPEDVTMDFVLVTFVFQHIGFRPPFGEMNVADITLEAMKHTREGTIWFVLEHEREELWQERWMQACNITPDIYFKPGGNHAGGGTIPYPEFESMTHRGNDNNLIIFKEKK
jgi:hypothetical protein